MIQLIQLQQVHMKAASLLLTVSLCLTAVGVTMSVYDVGVRCTAGKICINCVPLQHDYCMDKNISGLHLSQAIQPPWTTNLPTFSQNSRRIQQRQMPIKLLSQPLVMPSPFLTSLFPTVSLFLIGVDVTTRVAVDAADVWKLETLALIAYCYGEAALWITKLVGIRCSWAIRLLTTKLPTFPQINWQVRHHQIPFNLLS